MTYLAAKDFIEKIENLNNHKKVVKRILDNRFAVLILRVDDDEEVYLCQEIDLKIEDFMKAYFDEIEKKKREILNNFD